ncbi:MAG: hypothetical protein D6683_07140 [Actinomyces sp.]|nr:MAG: hypothetical protein D6683_07140 [Actinomyces sp.]
MPDGTDDPTLSPEDLSRFEERVRSVLEAAWVDLGPAADGTPRGYTAPHPEVYPWLWSWDSCFHALVWARLGRPDRALIELAEVFAHQGPDGFVPHMGYQRRPGHHAAFWGRPASSCITQPPIFGHTVAELARRGIEVPERLVEASRAGVLFLLRHRRRDPSGLVRVVHPWETGCDDSPRWDDLCPGGFDRERWRTVKGDLVATVEFAPTGSPVDNPACPVAPAGFNALVAHAAAELATVTGDDELAAGAREVADALDARFDPGLATWVDAGVTERGSGRVRTVDALCGVLVTGDARARSAVTAVLLDPAAHASPHGPTGVHRAEPAYSSTAYWRGPVWPQLAYLLRAGLGGGPGGGEVAASTVRGARRSGLAEYWEPDTGRGLGAVPQSWSGLAVVLADALVDGTA